MKTEQRISIFISILIILLTAGCLLYININHAGSTIHAKNGVMDLENLPSNTDDLINLDGIWEFYPGVLIEPAEAQNYYGLSEKASIFDKAEYRKNRRFINVPGTWTPALNEGGSAEGSGTYRLVINVPKEGVYGIKTNTIRTAARIFMNNLEIVSMGKPSLDYAGFIPGSKFNTAIATSSNKKIELLIHVSSYDYRAGGILKSIKFGTANAIIRQNNISRAVDGLIISACLALAIHSLFHWLQRREELFMLFVSLTEIFMSIYLSTLNEQLLNLVLNYGFYLRIKIQIFMMIMITVCFLQFIRHFFQKYKNDKMLKVSSATMLFMLLFLFNTPGNHFFIPVGVVQSLLGLGLLVSYGYSLFILMLSLKREEGSRGYILVLFTSLLSYWIVMVLKMLFEMEIRHAPAILIVTIVFCVSLLMSNRLQMDHKRATELSEELIRYDRMKDDFLAKTSHELRTPLHVVMNLTKLMLEGKKGTLSNAQHEDMVFIHHESRRLARLVDDLLDASSIEAGNIKLAKRPLSLYMIVKSLVREMALIMPDEKCISINNEIPENFPLLFADSDRLRQIIYNLLHNAIKFTAEGSISITASIKGREAEIKISDTGKGIPEGDIVKVFESLYSSSTKESGEAGLGLGLTITKHLVESHDGKIWADSTLNIGTSFHFTIPLYNSEIRDEATDKAFILNKNAEKTGETGETGKPDLLPQPDEKEYTRIPEAAVILIADDEISNQKVLADILLQENLNVLLAETGAEAISIINKNRVDLVILDIMLPDMPGYYVCEKIRKEFSLPELPILMLTASGRTSDLKQSFEYGANDFLKKPADGDELISRIKSLLLMRESAEERLKKEFQYFYLQISPHFLYNTLNTVIGLSYSDIESARKALCNLGTYLRGKMNFHRQRNLVTLESELELMAAYLEIEQMRHKDRLKTILDIDEDIIAMIPPLTIQPIVENSIRHGLMGSSDLEIQISIKREQEGLISIKIADNGPGIPREKLNELMAGESKGLGFANVMRRINLIRGGSITLDSELGQGTCAVIKVPEVTFNESDYS